MGKWAKSIAVKLFGIVALVLAVSLAVQVHQGMPSRLRVLVCPNMRSFYAPQCASECRDLKEASIITIKEAYKQGYKPAQSCQQANLFGEYDGSLLMSWLDQYDIWKTRPWNADGSWRGHDFPPLPFNLDEEQRLYVALLRIEDEELTGAKLEEIKGILRDYRTRTGYVFPKDTKQQFEGFVQLYREHGEEFAKCLRTSYASHKVTMTPRLIELRKKLDEAAGVSASPFGDLDERLITSAASQTKWIDDEGAERKAVDAREIDELLTENARKERNLQRVAAMFSDPN